MHEIPLALTTTHLSLLSLTTQSFVLAQPTYSCDPLQTSGLYMTCTEAQLRLWRKKQAQLMHELSCQRPVSSVATLAIGQLTFFSTHIRRIVILDETLWGHLDFYLFSILSEDVEEAEKRDLRNMTSVALTHATLVSAKLCFILLGMTTLLDWSKTAQSVQSVNELRQLMRDLGKPKHCDRCGKSPSASSYLESELQNETVLNAHRRDASCAS